MARTFLSMLERVSAVRDGVNYGAQGYLISSSDAGDLIWFPPCTQYIDRGTGSKYCPGELIFCKKSDNQPHYREHVRVARGGTAKRAFIKNYELAQSLLHPKLPDVFGQPLQQPPETPK